MDIGGDDGQRIMDVPVPPPRLETAADGTSGGPAPKKRKPLSAEAKARQNERQKQNRLKKAAEKKGAAISQANVVDNHDDSSSSSRSDDDDDNVETVPVVTQEKTPTAAPPVTNGKGVQKSVEEKDKENIKSSKKPTKADDVPNNNNNTKSKKSLKTKTHPTDPEASGTIPTKKSRTVPTPKTALPLICTDGPTWVIGTKLKFPGVDVTVTVNDVFRALISVPPNNGQNETENVQLVNRYREVLRIEPVEEKLLVWGMAYQSEFLALMHLLQILVPTTTVPVPDNKPKAVLEVDSGILNNFTMLLSKHKIASAVDLTQYMTKPVQDYRALPGLVEIARILVSNAEPRGGKAIHAFLNDSNDVRDMKAFIRAFIATYPSLEQAQEQATLVCSAFKALFF
jgi:hypothetical protein